MAKSSIDPVKRLAHFVHLGKVENLSTEVVAFFVEQALFEQWPSALSPKAIVTKIKSLFVGLSFSVDEFTAPLQLLLKQSRIVEKKSDMYALESSRAKKMETAIQEATSSEEKIYSDWQQYIAEAYKGISSQQLKDIVKDLRLYVNYVFSQHGAECAALLYPDAENGKQQGVILSARSEAFSQLSNRGEALNKIRLKEFPAFFLDAPRDRKLFLSDLLDATFIYHVVALDDECSALVKKVYQGVVLLLDTNIVYELVGLMGSVKQKLVRRVLREARQMGIKTRVTSSTVDEFRKSIRLTETQVARVGLPRDLAKIGAIRADELEPLTLYWKAQADTGISVEDFFTPYSHIVDLLNKEGVSITNEMRDEIEGSKLLQEETERLKSVSEKTSAVAEHDAFHRLWVLKKRQKETKKDRPSAWFLTADTVLSLYDQGVRKKGREMPFTVLPHQLIQILRPLMPRSENFDATFVELLSIPNVRTFDMPTHIAQKVLGVIARYKDYPPDLAASVLADQHFIQKVITADKKSKKELIEHEVIMQAQDALEEQKKIRAHLDKTEKKSQEDVLKLNSEIENLKEIVDRKEKAVSDERGGKDIWEKKYRRLREWLIKGGIMTLLAILLAATDWYIYQRGFWGSTSYVKAGILVVNVLTLGLIGYVLKKTWAIAAALVAIIGLFFAAVQGFSIISSESSTVMPTRQIEQQLESEQPALDDLAPE